MIRLCTPPLLKGHPLAHNHTVNVESTDRTDIGVSDISTHTHLAFEAICQEEDLANYRDLLMAQLNSAAMRWERHYDAVASALRL